MEVYPMDAEKKIKGIKLKKYRTSHVSEEDDSPPRSICSLKNRENIKEIEEKEECFILEFDPYDSLDYDDVKLFVSKNVEDDDLYVIGEKGQVVDNPSLLFIGSTYVCFNVLTFVCNRWPVEIIRIQGTLV
ncbi:Uncharacterized protein Fot_20089 [Forsythia ovata]|uniref:Uncharacterized protein n=1 Tax=Forsythia ovata TaxID=205694 RepID=A0ABD1VPZ4_9LAMI